MINNLELALKPGAVWPPASETERLEAYKVNRKLFEGDHDKVFYHWIKLLRDDQKATLELIINFHKRLSTLWGDLLVGEKPTITVTGLSEEGEKYFDKKINNEKLFQEVYKVIIDGSRYGDGIFKNRWDKVSKIEAQPPAYWIQVSSPDNIHETQAHILGYTFQGSGKAFFGMVDTVVEYLKLEIHEKGKITNRLFIVKNGKIQNEVDYSQYFEGSDAVIETQVDEFLVNPFHNLLTSDRAEGLDDYKDLMTLIQEIEIRLDQISKILDKHSEPGMFGPASALYQDPETGVFVYKGAGKYIPLEPGDTAPGYVTWDGKIDAAFKEIEVILEQMYFVSETCPAAFGQLKTGLAESGSALKRLMLAPLKKVERLKLFLDPLLKRVILNALLLEQAHGVNLGIKDADDIEIKIDWKDGLPQDPKEQAEIEAIRTGNKATSSIKAAIMRLDNATEAQAEDQLKDILDEEKQNQPLLLKPKFDNTDPAPTDPPAAAGGDPTPAAGTGGAAGEK